MTSELLRERVGYSNEGGADKEYRIAVIRSGDEAFQLLAHNGRRGRATTVAQDDRFTSAEAAIEAADKLQAKKEKRHYHFSDSDGHSAPSASATKREDTGLRPQLQTPIARDRLNELAHDDDFVLQRKYDGEHLLVRKNADGSATYANKLGFATAVPGHLERAIATAPFLSLSGELLNHRYVVFDVLSENGFDVRHYAYEQRLAILRRYADDFDSAIVVAPTAHTTDEKLALIDVVDLERGEGWIAKRKSAPYTDGRKHSDQFKCKRWKSATCRVVAHNSGARSIRVGVFADNAETIVGDVSVKANQSIPQIGSFVEVKYLDYRAGGRLTQPELLRVRTDAKDADCSISQLEGLAADA